MGAIDQQVRAVDAFLYDAIEAALSGDGLRHAMATVSAAVGVASLPIVLGRLSRFHGHIDGVGWSLLAPLDAEAVLATAIDLGDAVGLDVSRPVARVHATFTRDVPVRWPSERDGAAERGLTDAGLLLVLAAIEELADGIDEPLSTLHRRLFG